MNRMSRSKSLLALSMLGLATPLLAFSGHTTPDDSLAQWSHSLWEQAKAGDRLEYPSFRETIEDLPPAAATAASTAHFREALGAYTTNLSKANQKRDDARNEALTEMQEFIVDSKLSQALRSAVKAQSLSSNYDAIFGEPGIQNLVSWSENEIPEVERDRDWLLAQELLFRLRTLYEDTPRIGDFDRLDKQLDAVNKRVALLARYAPRRLHELRNMAAERIEEEPLGEFNAANAPNWRERTERVDRRMLRDSLQTAASEHIEQRGWGPLLVGGLNALQLIATTPALSETFTDLSNADRVSQWVNHIDQEIHRIRTMPRDELDRWTFNNVMEELLRINDQTIRLPREVIYVEFGDGAMNELDKFSEIIWPDAMRRFAQATEGNFVGVGILIRHDEKREIMVVNPLEGSPAYFAGVKPDDLIESVDEESTVGWSLNDAVDRITGKAGSKVTLGLKRQGYDDPIRITITRDTIKLRSVRGWWKEGLDGQGDPEWNWYVDPVSRIAYIRLTQFSDDTFDDLRAAWREINEHGAAKGLILDLRFNPGGLLTSAVRISNLWVKDGLIVSGEDKQGRTAWQRPASRTDARLADTPTVVLINKGSASASEIVSGCLQAHGAAIVLGERSYGKGSVQTVHRVSRQSSLKLTTQYYRLPPPMNMPGEKGRLVHKRPGAAEWGVDPDVLVMMTPTQVTDSLELRRVADIIPEDDDGNLDPNSPERPDINTMLSEGIDPQLNTALLLLQARALSETSDDTRRASAN